MEENEKKENTENKRMNWILLAILIVSILDFVTSLIKG